ncbi:MAG TPA: hypothetical protein DDZ51_14280 [Planctomycetaceae bacterium]|nr:hypothetical protein [Planctomycetaceae bacterium]
MSSNIRSSRSRSYIDPGVQGSLLRKLSFHWLVLIAVNCGVFGAWVWLFERADSSAGDAVSTAFSKCLPFLLTSAALLPIFLFDALRLTSRFAGPALRFRASLSDAAEGLPVRPMQFRHDDFWQEMADSFNTLMVRQKEADRVIRENQLALAAKSEEAVPVAESETVNDCQKPTVNSADEALRLLDSVTA